jgi:hypothetical protein
MAHSHYVVDLYFRDTTNPDRLHHEALRIVADNDDAAIAEGKRIDGWKHPHSFQVRSIKSSTRSGDVVVYASPPLEDGIDDPVVVMPAELALKGERE